MIFGLLHNKNKYKKAALPIIMLKVLNLVFILQMVTDAQYIAPPRFHQVSKNDNTELNTNEPVFYSHIPNTVTHLYVAPNSYLCTCITINTAKNIPSLNATAWDDVCSNIQTCTWNKEEIMIKTWYHIN